MANSYCLPSDGDLYLQGRMFAEKWFSATPDRKEMALAHATKIIEALSFRGLKVTTTQVLSWPRILISGAAPEFPQEIRDACCEIALALLNGIDPEKEFRNVSKIRQGYGSLGHAKDTNLIDRNFVNGVPSMSAWNLLHPYLMDVAQAVMYRGT